MAGPDDGSLDLQGMTFDERSQVLRAYYVPHVHRPDGFYDCTIRDTYAIVRFDINNGDIEAFCVKNMPNKHAEKTVIAKLEAALTDRRRSTDITELRVYIYLNYSPCNQGCCEALIKFKADEEQKQVMVMMYVTFANFYNVNRPRCVADNCQHYQSHPVDPDVDTDNQTGLRALNRADIRLRTFTPADWKCVDNVLFEGTRDDEDERVRQDLDRILGEGQ